jgi:cellulose synthase/poly-beta-1,6-N-acetylglucosamine synthase-like glycosyltransferase
MHIWIDSKRKIMLKILPMLTANINFFMVLHFAALFGLLLYGLHRVWLLYSWQSEKKKKMLPGIPASLAEHSLPLVTVQLPLFNERFVAKRLLDAIAQLDYPRDKLEIQVLDDSEDDTRELVDERSSHWLSRGLDVTVLRRTDRAGFKAGALQNGLKRMKGDFVAIFDADFVPPRNFLRRTIPYFADNGVGMVQTRWSFLNSQHCWLTRLQSLLLGQHFIVEHFVRFRKGLFFNFNGTAGVWRKKAIESSGGWQDDTVTEDLDLSYRAELLGWRFVYLNELPVPSELPANLSSFRSQQQRWAKGSVQTAKKLLPRLLKSELPLSIKFEATAHLLSNLCWLLAAVVTLTLYATITWRVSIGPYQMLRLDLPLFMGTSFALFIYFVTYEFSQNKRASLCSLFLLPPLTIGIAPSIAMSVIGGLLRTGGTFTRTPKFGLEGKEKLPCFAFLYRQKVMPYIAMNTLFFLYSLLPLFFVAKRGTWFALPFIMLFPFGFLLVIYKDAADIVRVGKVE